MSLDLKDVIRTDYVKNYFNRNEKIFTISLIIFVLFSVMGALVFDIEDIVGQTGIDQKIRPDKTADAYRIDEDSLEKIYYEDSWTDENYREENLIEYEDNSGYREEVFTSLFADYNFMGFVYLFWHNFSIDFGCILGGLLLSIPSLITTFINAGQIGALLSQVNFIIILFGVAPHGIFEVPSSLFALAGAFMLTSFEVKLFSAILSSTTSIKEEINRSIYLVKDAIISAEIVFVLLIIAAFIETFVTPLLLWLII